MIDHMTFRVADMAATKAFYEKALAPVGYAAAYDGVHDGMRIVGFGRGGKIDTWFVDAKPASGAVHIAWVAESRAAVDAFYKAAIAAGGKDNGPPGVRAHYHANYYGAFVLDPDGNNIEAVCHQPA